MSKGRIMRIRRMTALFWGICIIAVVFILYVVTDLSFKLPYNKPMMELDENKWSVLQSKLKSIEKELNHHHEVVGEIKLAVGKIFDKSSEPSLSEKQSENRKPVLNEGKKMREYKAASEEHHRKHVTVKFNTSLCPIKTDSAPKTDIQMLSMYERISFEDVDGGVWKQGWDIEYNENQWSQKNKLKVFIVPHSHNDPGWLKTFENYYKTQTKAIFDNMMEKLGLDSKRKFIWAETSFLSLWWDLDATEKEKTTFKTYLDAGQVEIVTGGWVMNDEANSHWLSVIQQFTTGHQWLLKNIGYIPRNAWAIDPFGHSSSQPYLLKLAGFKNSVIQRVHYRVKNVLAMNKQLEFKWRQLWDGVGKTDMFTHMMPFYSYDIPHTCGPDPKICCQFDFKRLPGNGVTCPWGVAPRKIIQKNVRERASVILDQWRKKAQLYRSNVVLVPLGDDFRYDRSNEWDNQYLNYEMLMDFINSQEAWNADVQFGTLEDYFREVHKEVKISDFPVLSGDFFTYADRNEHYWSGYYTSRPFYKNMDRVLLAYVRAAEIMVGQATTGKVVTHLQSLQLRDSVEAARRALALFQHHDGITGTSRNEVREDYAKKLFAAIKHSQSAIQQAAYFLLKEPPIKGREVLDEEGNKVQQDDVFFIVDDIWRHHDDIPTRMTTALDVMAPSKNIILYNALLFKRTEIFTILVSTPDVEVLDPQGHHVMAQVTPLIQGEKHIGLTANKFQLSFPVTVGPLALAIYTVSLRDPSAINLHTSYSSVRVYNADYLKLDLPNMFQVKQPSARLDENVEIRVTNGTAFTIDNKGMIKFIQTNKGQSLPVDVKFVQYGTQRRIDNNSGAYLFIPDGEAEELGFDPYPEIIVTEGLYKSTVHVSLISDKNVEILMAATVYNNPSLAQTEVEISNTLLIAPEVDDIEVAMRFNTDIKNGDTFYTDLNGMQMIKRKYFRKLPLQANFYPLPAAAYIEDDKRRFTVLTSTPLGMAALREGQIEIMQDRRLSKDDNRGLNQGVMDNVRTRHIFKFIFEDYNTACEQHADSSYPSGHLSLGAHVSQQYLLQPLIPLLYLESVKEPRPSFSRVTTSQSDLVLASFNAHVLAKTHSSKSHQGVGKPQQGMGLTVQRVYLNKCYGNYKLIAESYPVGDGQLDITDVIDVKPDNVFESSLTFNTIGKPVESAVITLCPMEIRSVFINETLKHR